MLYFVIVTEPVGIVRRVLDHEDDEDLVKYLVSGKSLWVYTHSIFMTVHYLSNVNDSTSSRDFISP